MICLTNTLSRIFIVLGNWNDTPREGMSFPRAHYHDSVPTSLFYFLTVTCLVEQQLIQALLSALTQSNPQSTTLEANLLTITPAMWFQSIEGPGNCKLILYELLYHR